MPEESVGAVPPGVVPPASGTSLGVPSLLLGFAVPSAVALGALGSVAAGLEPVAFDALEGDVPDGTAPENGGGPDAVLSPALPPLQLDARLHAANPRTQPTRVTLPIDMKSFCHDTGRLSSTTAPQASATQKCPIPQGMPRSSENSLAPLAVLRLDAERCRATRCTITVRVTTGH
jgi:hypothetical protein